MHMFGCLVALLCLATLSTGFYLPGVAERHYKIDDKEGAPVLQVNKLTSINTQLPFKYYYLPFCRPDAKTLKKTDKHENIGEIIKGDKIELSLYEVVPLQNIVCRAINYGNKTESPEKCTKYSKSDIKQFESFVKDKYRAHWILDNLPAVVPVNGQQDQFKVGFPLGPEKQAVGDRIAIHNHLDITVRYNKQNEVDSVVIISLEIIPRSKQYNFDSWNNHEECPQDTGDLQYLGYEEMKDDDIKPIVWTYSLNWAESTKLWTHRWDVYLQNTSAEIHWISIVNSLMIVLFLTGMVAMIMMRTLRADLRRYNQQELSDDEGETGWKLVHGDVFRPPRHPMALAVMIGSGVQVLGMTVVTLVFAVLGFLSPAQRGMLVTAFVVLFVIMGVFAGYFSTRCYKMFKGNHGKKNTIMTAVAFPGIIFAIFFVINMFEYHAHSSSAVPVGTLAALIALWLGISVPLVFFGSYFANRKPLQDDPVRTNQIPRQIPEQVWYMSPVLSILMGGILPFGAVFIELFFILYSVWDNHFYYIFGFLFIVFLILIVTCAEITVVMCYFQLCAEDYNWWWRSFLTAGASAFYMFLYSIFYFVTNLEIDKFVSGLIYFGYTLIMTITFFVLTGSVGFYACYFFVRKIYSSIHVD